MVETLLDHQPGESLNKALATAKFEIPDEWIEKTDGLVEVEADLIKCQTALGKLLPIEEDAKQALRTKLRNLKTLRRQLTYPQLSLEPFTWRDKEGYPVFALFDVNGGEFRISENEEGLMVPEPIKKSFVDISSRLRTTNSRNIPFWAMGIGSLVAVILGNIGILGWIIHGIMSTSPQKCLIPWYMHLFAIVIAYPLIGWLTKGRGIIRTIVARYAGVIPDKTRLRIEKLRDDFDSIHILAEVPKWELEKVVPPLSDPLILGFADNAFYLLDVYDTTPIEDYVRQKFVA